MIDLKNTLKEAFKGIITAVWMFCTQVTSVSGCMGFMVMPLLLWVLILPNRGAPFVRLELSYIFIGGSLFGLIIFYLGIGIFCISLSQWFWYRHKKEKFFTKGLYSKVRHPQFLGIILTSLGITIKLLSISDSWGFSFLNLPKYHLGINELIGLWFLQVLGYIAFALLEERSLSKRFLEFKDYKQKVPLLLPIKKPKVIPEAVFSIILVLIICVTLSFLPYKFCMGFQIPPVLISCKNRVLACGGRCLGTVVSATRGVFAPQLTKNKASS